MTTLTDQEGTNPSFTVLIKTGNCLGILPVNGLNNVFNWKSPKNFYTYAMIVCFSINSVFCFIHWTFVKFSFKLLALQLHEINALTVLLLYLFLAKKWAKFMVKWEKIDKEMIQIYGFPKDFKKRMSIITLLLFLSTLSTILLSDINQYTKIKDNSSVDKYFQGLHPTYFNLFPFNGFLAVFVTFTTITGHLIWTFNDLFIISISSALALRFKQITNRLRKNERKTNTKVFWTEIRDDYNKLAYLCKKLDRHISYIVLLSFAANVFFLLILLSNNVESWKGNNDLDVLLNLWNLIVLIGRLSAVSIYGAWVNDESKEPSLWLTSVPSATYNSEIRRFLMQISFDDVAITGSKMFRVTRGLILNVAGAIVTYELVVIQFNTTLK